MPRDNELFVTARSRSIQTSYKLTELVEICTDDAFPDRIALKFKSHNQNVVLLSHINDHTRYILSFIYEHLALNNQEHIIDKAYKIDMGSFSYMERYIIKYDYDFLTNLILENVNLRCLFGLENMSHLQTISLSGSKLGKTQNEKETFWNWMMLKNITKSLTILLMDNVDLQVVPFEMQYLTKLETLSMTHNELRFLPHFIGDLTALSRLFVDNNHILYFPYELQNRRFIDVSIEETWLGLPLGIKLYLDNTQSKPPVKNTPEKLTNLALFSIINNKVQFERKDINRPLWKYFNNISRCHKCNKMMITYPTNTFYKIDVLYNRSIPYNILWLYPQCLYPCKQES